MSSSDWSSVPSSTLRPTSPVIFPMHRAHVDNVKYYLPPCIDPPQTLWRSDGTQFNLTCDSVTLSTGEVFTMPHDLPETGCKNVIVNGINIYFTIHYPKSKSNAGIINCDDTSGSRLASRAAPDEITKNLTAIANALAAVKNAVSNEADMGISAVGCAAQKAFDEDDYLPRYAIYTKIGTSEASLKGLEHALGDGGWELSTTSYDTSLPSGYVVDVNLMQAQLPSTMSSVRWSCKKVWEGNNVTDQGYDLVIPQGSSNITSSDEKPHQAKIEALDYPNPVGLDTLVLHGGAGNYLKFLSQQKGQDISSFHRYTCHGPRKQSLRHKFLYNTLLDERRLTQHRKVVLDHGSSSSIQNST